jgi:hypothetical protein
MTKEELDHIVTVKDLEIFYQKIVNEVKGLLFDKKNPQKEFYTPKEFSHICGMKYSTVVYRCKVGKLKARQDNPNSSWSIFASEVERFKTEACENML